MRNKQFWMNVALYLILILGFLYLYFPFNNDPARRTKATIEFVYENF
jgi:hypothetical protein